MHMPDLKRSLLINVDWAPPQTTQDATRTSAKSAIMNMNDNHLAQLPEELLQETLNFLDGGALFCLSQTCKWAYLKAIPLIWHDVELVDCRTRHPDMPYHSDEHDDTPIIKILLVLSSNQWIASQVHTLEHRCHLPPPALFSELPLTNFQSRFLSHDPRTLLLLERACANLSSLHTLRIIFGHWNITKGLLNGILNQHTRKHTQPLRKLWLESCSITGLSACMLRCIDLRGLESIRIRRLQLLKDTGLVHKHQVYARGHSAQTMQDGQGGIYYSTTDQWNRQEAAFENAVESWDTSSSPSALHDWEKMFEDAHIYDDIIYDQIIESTKGIEYFKNEEWPHKIRATEQLQEAIDHQHPNHPAPENVTEPLPAIIKMLSASAETLTSLNLDWVITRRVHDLIALADAHTSLAAFREVFRLRFPCLRAFQLRNTVVKECQVPTGLFLLDECSMGRGSDNDVMPSDLCISFMEAHPKLRCLAWPMDMFFNSTRTQRSPRVASIVERLALNLVELRVDTMYDSFGEFQSDDAATNSDHVAARGNRRLFITEFASKMQTVEHLKVEGGIPRDERRETIRALGNCPLQKVVLIGVNSPIGNTWGLRGQDIEAHGINEDFSDPNELQTLEFEDIEAISRLGAIEPKHPGQPFQAEYGWPPSAPLIHTLACYHANTITELKFCGYRGAAVLWNPTLITTPMLSNLRTFHKLQSLVLSLWLPTCYQDEYRDDEIIAYWLNTRGPNTTALVAPIDIEPTGWARELADKFAPVMVATQMKNVLGPFLSERAKARKGGVHVRGSFCIGVFGGIYDFDIQIGKAPNGEDGVLEWTGPREELHPIRRQQKLQRRRWF